MSYVQSPNEASNKKHKQGKGTEEIVRQHLEDPNHVITEEDIKNVVVGNFEDSQEYQGELVEEEADVTQEDDTAEGQKPATPWDVVS